MPESPSPDWIDVTIDVVDFIADFLTIIISSIGVAVFLTQREKIKSAFNLLLTFSLRVTLSELVNKLDKLNELNADDAVHGKQVINVFKDIEGQLNGNKFLRQELETILAKIERFCSKPEKISEANKRSLVAELRERIRHVDVSNYNTKEAN